jgi:hypothetical protein
MAFVDARTMTIYLIYFHPRAAHAATLQRAVGTNIFEAAAAARGADTKGPDCAVRLAARRAPGSHAMEIQDRRRR